MYTCGNRKVIPNMPDLILRKIFEEYDYPVLCKMERVCKRWMNIINLKFRKEIHEVSIERVRSIPVSINIFPISSLDPRFLKPTNAFLSEDFQSVVPPIRTTSWPASSAAAAFRS